MTLYEVFYLSVIKRKNIEMKERNVVSFSCPQCKKHLVTHEFIDNKKNLQYDQKYLYYDGDTVYVKDEIINRLYADMNFGACEKCGHQITCISTDILDRDVYEYEDINNNTNCFFVLNEDEFIKDFDTAKQYELLINNIAIGYMIIYKNAVLNKDELCDVSTDITRNLCQIELTCLSNDTDMNYSNIGVCNGHYINNSQRSVWEMAAKVVENIYNEMKELINTERMDSECWT